MCIMMGFSRFLVACLPEVYVTLGEKVAACAINDAVDMDVLFAISFRRGHIFTLTEEAMALFANYHDEEVLKFRKTELFDDNKSMIKSKSIGIVLRVAAVQCALRHSLNALLDASSEEVIAPEASEIEDADVAENVADTERTSFALLEEDDSNKVHVDTALVSINHDDIQRAITIVKYSVNCLFELVNSTNNAIRKSAKRCLEMPDVENIDMDFLIHHKNKVQKLYSDATNYEISTSTITKNHVYPQIGAKPTSKDAWKFLRGLENHGIGKLTERNEKFVLTNPENIQSAEKLANFRALGL